MDIISEATSMVDRHLKRSADGAEPPATHNVTIDLYGEEFNFKASTAEARRLIKAFERVNAARRDVTRLKDELATAKEAAFDGIWPGNGAGIVVDDPDAGGKTEAA